MAAMKDLAGAGIVVCVVVACVALANRPKPKTSETTVKPTPTIAIAARGPVESDSAYAAMERWNTQNEECVGGNHLPGDVICRQRDRSSAALEKQGWCWAYSDYNVTPVDYAWHRCDVARPANFIQQTSNDSDASDWSLNFAPGDPAAKGIPEGDALVTRCKKIKDGVFSCLQRTTYAPPSKAFLDYVAAVDPLALAIGRENVKMKCGLSAGNAGSGLNQHIYTAPEIRMLRADISDAENKVAEQHFSFIAKEVETIILGSGTSDYRNRCKSLARRMVGLRD